ncbi:MAG: CHAT domain-containing protein, partial [Myxococcales bacterium]|nr:CHAT domain-containing protein [Myxococcales bacterium]
MAIHLVLHWLSDGPEGARVGLAHHDGLGLRAPVAWVHHRVNSAGLATERRALEAGLPRAVAGGGMDPLVAHGRALFDLILPAAVKAALRAGAGRLTVITDAAALPWALLHDGTAWVGLRWALGTVPAIERVLTPPAAAPEGDRLLVVADPAGDLPAARNEGEGLLRQLARAGEGLACDLRLGHLARQDFLRLFRGFRLVHFAGHADAGPEGQGGWRFADGHLAPAALAQLAGGGAPGLVFANACRSVATADQASPSGGLVDALLAVGVRHVIGTAVDLPDLPGATFAARFYAGLRAGLSVGGAMQAARVRAAQAGDPVWAAYRLFGPPDAVYFQRRAATELGGGPRPGVVVAARLPAPQAADPEAFADGRQRIRGA